MRNCLVFVGQDDFLIEKNVLTDAKYGKKSASNTGNVKMEKLPKGSTLDFIIKDASDPYDKMPLNSMDVDRMTTNGTYFANQQFVCKDEFVKFLKTNKVFGSQFSKDFYLYTVARQYAMKLNPSGYHMKNFPNVTSMMNICLSKYLIISPFPKNRDEKIEHFNTIKKVDGQITIDIEECNSDDSSESHDEKYVKKESLDVEEDPEEMPYSGEHSHRMNDTA